MPFFVILLIIIASGIVIDQVTKILVISFMDVYESIPLIDGVLNITYIQNKGMAFGWLSDHRWVFMSISVIAIAGLSVYLFRFCKERKLIKIGIAMIISGGIGNMIDRTILSYVVDMIDVALVSSFFPFIFNFADSFVCIGAGLVALGLVLDIVKDTKNKKSVKTNDSK